MQDPNGGAADRLITNPQPRPLLVVGSFAALPYIHLHLESRKRFYPDVPMVIHDDASPFTSQLQDICVAYQVNFFSPRERIGHQSGDLAASLLAIQSAQALGCDLAVKMSRSFIPLTNWVPQLQDVAARTQYATYSHRCRGYGFGFRSECVAFHAPTWSERCEEQIERAVEAGRESFDCVEVFLHRLARQVQTDTQCRANQSYELLYPRDPDTNAYGIWPWLGDDGTAKQPGCLWHRADSSLDYYRLSLAYGLDYRQEDFSDPNMGCGVGPDKEW